MKETRFNRVIQCRPTSIICAFVIKNPAQDGNDFYGTRFYFTFTFTFTYAHRIGASEHTEPLVHLIGHNFLQNNMKPILIFSALNFK